MRWRRRRVVGPGDGGVSVAGGSGDIDELVRSEAWAEVWRLARSVAPERAVPLLRQLGQSGWRPRSKSDGSRFEQLVALADQCPPEMPRGLCFREVRTLRPGPDFAPIDSVAISPDGALVATSGSNACLWRLRDGSEVADLEGVDAESLMFTPDGGLVVGTGKAEVGLDDFVLVWEVPTGRLVRKLECSSPWGYDGLAVIPDSTLVAVGGGDGTVRLWDIATGAVVTTLTGPTWGAKHLTISPDGRLLAVAAGDGQLEPAGHGCVQVWELPSGTPVTTIDRGGERIDPVAFVADGQLAGVCGDGHVRLWKLPSGTLQATLDGKAAFVWGLATARNGELLLACGYDGRLVPGGFNGALRIWEVSTGRLVTTSTRSERIPHLCVDAAGTMVVTGDLAGGICWSDLPSAEHNIGQHRHTVRSLAISPDGETVVSGHDRGTAMIWRPALELVARTPSAEQDAVALIGLTDRAKRAPAEERAWLEIIDALARGPKG